VVITSLSCAWPIICVRIFSVHSLKLISQSGKTARETFLFVFFSIRNTLFVVGLDILCIIICLMFDCQAITWKDSSPKWRIVSQVKLYLHTLNLTVIVLRAHGWRICLQVLIRTMLMMMMCLNTDCSWKYKRASWKHNIWST